MIQRHSQYTHTDDPDREVIQSDELSVQTEGDSTDTDTVRTQKDSTESDTWSVQTEGDTETDTVRTQKDSTVRHMVGTDRGR